MLNLVHCPVPRSTRYELEYFLYFVQVQYSTVLVHKDEYCTYQLQLAITEYSVLMILVGRVREGLVFGMIVRCTGTTEDYNAS